MLKRLLLVVPISLAALAVVRPGAEAPPTPPVARYELSIGDQKVKIEPDTDFQLTLNGQPVRGKLVALPMQFSAVGVSFEYPKNMSYAFERLGEGVDHYALDGDDVVIMVQKYDDGVEADDAARMLIQQLGPELGGKAVKPERGKVTWGGKTFDTYKSRIAVGEVGLNVTTIGMKTSVGVVVITLQDSGKDDGSASEEYKRVLPILEKTFAVK